MKPGLLPVLWIEVAPRWHAALDPLSYLGIHAGGTVELASGRDYVRPRGEEPADLVEVAGSRHVQNAVGSEGHDLVEVLGRDDPDGLEPAQFPGVPPYLRRRVDVDAHQVQAWVLDDGSQGAVRCCRWPTGRRGIAKGRERDYR